MSTTQPIRDKKKLQDFKAFYREHQEDPNALRNYTLVVFGLGTALRISDILRLTWDDVLTGGAVRTHVIVREQKTGKENCVLLNPEVREALRGYLEGQGRREGNPYLFPSPRVEGAHLSRFQAYRIINRAAEALELEHVSCHSLRKTFGYHAWKQGAQPALLMSIFNHSSWAVTLRYLGIAQDEKDQIYARIAL